MKRDRKDKRQAMGPPGGMLLIMVVFCLCFLGHSAKVFAESDGNVSRRLDYFGQAHTSMITPGVEPLLPVNQANVRVGPDIHPLPDVDGMPLPGSGGGGYNIGAPVDQDNQNIYDVDLGVKGAKAEVQINNMPAIGRPNAGSAQVQNIRITGPAWYVEKTASGLKDKDVPSGLSKIFKSVQNKQEAFKSFDSVRKTDFVTLVIEKDLGGHFEVTKVINNKNESIFSGQKPRYEYKEYKKESLSTRKIVLGSVSSEIKYLLATQNCGRLKEIALTSKDISSAVDAVSALGTILETKGLDKMVYTYAVVAIKEIAKERPEVLRLTTLNALENIMKTRGGQLSAQPGAAMTIGLIALNTKDQGLSRECVAALEGILETPDLNYGAYSHSAIAIGYIAKNSKSNDISRECILSLENILNAQGAGSQVKMAAAMAIGYIYANSRDRDLTKRCQSILDSYPAIRTR